MVCYRIRHGIRHRPISQPEKAGDTVQALPWFTHVASLRRCLDTLAAAIHRCSTGDRFGYKERPATQSPLLGQINQVIRPVSSAIGIVVATAHSRSEGVKQGEN